MNALTTCLTRLAAACEAHGLIGGTVRVDRDTIVSYTPGEGAVIVGASGHVVNIPDETVTRVLKDEGART